MRSRSYSLGRQAKMALCRSLLAALTVSGVSAQTAVQPNGGEAPTVRLITSEQYANTSATFSEQMWWVLSLPTRSAHGRASSPWCLNRHYYAGRSRSVRYGGPGCRGEGH